MNFFTKNLLMILAAVLIVATGCSNEKDQEGAKPEQAKENAQEKEGVKEFIIKARPQTLEHIHGIGYPGNDKALYVASHEGIKIFKDGEWLETAAEQHDYMGFQAVSDGFVASGHPENGSDLKDPLGLVKSTDKGQSLEKLAFYGESDFHFMAASFNDDALYVINEKAGSEKEPGVYFSKDNGKNWEQAALKGFDAKTFGMLAAHPDQGETFAMATKEGVFLSEDSGQTVKEAGSYEMITAAAFSKDALFISHVEQKNIKLLRLGMDDHAEELAIPTLAYENPIIYITASYGQEGKIAFVTYEYDLYESTDGGSTWNQILSKGKIK